MAMLGKDRPHPASSSTRPTGARTPLVTESCSIRPRNEAVP